MSEPPRLQTRRMGGEKWLSAKLSIAPWRLPAFSVTWFRAEAAGPIPDWVLLLGAMGLHVFGEGSEMVVQGRPGTSPLHDELRLRLLCRFLHWEVKAGSPLVLTRSLSLTSEGDDEALPKSVREHLRAGYWALPARRGLPGAPADALPPMRPMQRRRGVARVPGLAPRPPPSRATMYAARAGVGLSLLVGVVGASVLEDVPYVGWLLVFAWLTFMMGVLMRLARLAQDPSTPFTPLLYACGTSSTPTPESLDPPDGRPLFVQLHDALTSEGYARLVRRKNPSEATQWEAHMAFVLNEYYLLMNPPMSQEEVCSSAT